jgi:hypothetical protein
MRGVALLVLLAVASGVRAAVATPVSVEDLARTSDAVVRGHVEAATARLTPDGLRVVTDVEVSVVSVWRGAAPARVKLVVPGGSLGKLAQRVDAAPVLAKGEEVVVFLLRRGEVYLVNGLALGKYRVEGTMAHPDLHGIEFRDGSIRPGEARVARMPVAELEHRVRAAP